MSAPCRPMPSWGPTSVTRRSSRPPPSSSGRPLIGTPVYKAAYSGLLKALLDLLPQYALAGKTVLPLATGGTTAHVRAIDYALRPVLNSMGPAHITPGWFTLDKDITVGNDGTLTVTPGSAEVLAQVTDQFSPRPRRPPRTGRRRLNPP